MGDTHIQWTDKTWNCVRGCSKVSEGCRNCYAMTVAHRFSGPGLPYEGLAHKVNGNPEWTNLVRELPEKLGEPLAWRKPCRIFVNSMSDLFHEQVSVTFIDQVWSVMARCPQHTFQILTKRPERMRYVVDHLLPCGILPNVWLGVSAEDQATADERIPLLLQTPAAVRFVSAEPLLGPIHMRQFLADFELGRGEWGNLHWIIVGGESGPGARRMDLEWVRCIVSDTHIGGVACFVKQLGSFWARRHSGSLKGDWPQEWDADLRIREFPV